MSISFAEFILRYLDEWNLETGYLCDDLGISIHTLNNWVYRGQIPNSYNIESIELYFGQDFKDVVFDGKKFRRKFKVIRADGSSEIYPTLQQVVWNEGVAYTTIIKCLQEDIPVGRGDCTGYRFQRVYLEEDQEHEEGDVMHDRYMNEDANQNEYIESIKKRRRRAIDSDVERAVDKIYDDLQEMILEWKSDNAIRSYGSTPDDYSDHRIGTMRYAETLTDAITEELASRIIDDDELNEITYLEEVMPNDVK